MKFFPSTLLAFGLLLTQALPGHSDPHAAWQYTQTVEVPAAGLVRFEVPPATLSASSPHLDDLRLVSPKGIETPYVVEWPQLDSGQTRLVAAFRAALNDQNTVL